MTTNTASVAARLGLQARFTEEGFRLRDFGATVQAFRPERLDLAFLLSASGDASLSVTCDFFSGSGREDAGERAALLKENLLRADIAGRFDCVFIDGNAMPFAGMQCLSVFLPDDSALPSGRWLALPLPLLDSAVDLFRHAQTNGLDVGYRIRLNSRVGDAALARRLAPALAELSARGRRPDLEIALRQAVNIVCSDGWTAMESFVLPSAAVSRDRVQNLLQRRLKATMQFFSADAWMMRWDEAPGEGASIDVQRARDAGYLDLIFDTIVPSQADSPLPIVDHRTEPCTDGDYIFVSYAHADRDYGLRVIDLMRAAHVRVWYDQGIEAGTVWDEELERRIRDAGAVVVCLTTHYEQSRYCTRELKFADLKAKRILPIAPKPWTWGEGLQLMFQELQVCAFQEGQGFSAFLRSLRAAAPRAFEGPQEESSPGPAGR